METNIQKLAHIAIKRTSRRNTKQQMPNKLALSKLIEILPSHPASNPKNSAIAKAASGKGEALSFAAPQQGEPDQIMKVLQCGPDHGTTEEVGERDSERQGPGQAAGCNTPQHQARSGQH